MGRQQQQQQQRTLYCHIELNLGNITCHSFDTKISQGADLKDNFLFWSFATFSIALMKRMLTNNHVSKRRTGKIKGVLPN